MAVRASAYLEAETDLLLTDLVLVETIYVLESFYDAPREQVARSARAFIAFPSITTVDADLLLRAIEVYDFERIDFAGACLVACAESTGVNRIASFDRSIDRVTTIKRIEPGP